MWTISSSQNNNSLSNAKSPQIQKCFVGNPTDPEETCSIKDAHGSKTRKRWCVEVLSQVKPFFPERFTCRVSS